MQNYNPKNPINFHDLIVMADELYTALHDTIDTVVEIYGNEACPTCGGAYVDDNGDTFEETCDETCSLNNATELCRRINADGQLKAVKKLHKVSN